MYICTHLGLMPNSGLTYKPSIDSGCQFWYTVILLETDVILPYSSVKLGCPKGIPRKPQECWHYGTESPVEILYFPTLQDFFSLVSTDTSTHQCPSCDLSEWRWADHAGHHLLGARALLPSSLSKQLLLPCYKGASWWKWGNSKAGGLWQGTGETEWQKLRLTELTINRTLILCLEWDDDYIVLIV